MEAVAKRCERERARLMQGRGGRGSALLGRQGSMGRRPHPVRPRADAGDASPGRLWLWSIESRSRCAADDLPLAVLAAVGLGDPQGPVRGKVRVMRARVDLGSRHARPDAVRMDAGV